MTYGQFLPLQTLVQMRTLPFPQVMMTYGLSAQHAHQYVSSRRHCIAVHEGFRNQLLEFEKLRKYQLQMSAERNFVTQQGVVLTRGNKRGREDGFEDDEERRMGGVVPAAKGVGNDSGGNGMEWS